MSEKIYRVQMNSKGMPNFSTAEPIIRCKECKYWTSDGGALMGCGLTEFVTSSDDFCSYGEPK